MIDKGKYSSHGVFIKKISEQHLSRWSKPLNAVINPISATKPRQKPSYEQQHEKMKLQSKTFQAGFKFQQPVVQKPLPQSLIQPFLYIEKVIRKAHSKKMQKPKKQEGKQQKLEDRKKNIKKQSSPKLKPFITSKNVSMKKNGETGNNTQKIVSPPGYSSLFDYELDRKNTAYLIFQKILESGVEDVKELYFLWDKNPRRPADPDININEEQFVGFLQDLIPNRVTKKTLQHFFQLYRVRPNLNKQTQNQISEAQQSGLISIKAFAFNYLKHKKAQTEIMNIMSEKAAKDRYVELKKYITDFLCYYPELKIGTKAMKEYEETLRKHFRRLFQSYQNPFEQEINQLKIQLEKPIIKYDKQKKQKLEKQLEQLEVQNSKVYSKLADDYNHFISSYEEAIVKNHDLLFTKRTIAYLLKPIIDTEPLLTRDLIQRQVAIRQQEKQKYLECLSDIVVQIDNDKKNLFEDCFTLGQIVYIVKMRFRGKKIKSNEQSQDFTIQSLKKLIKEIKRQFLIKFNLMADDLENFPADQEIPLQILHTCFEMQCTKVLFKNKIWTQLLDMLPGRLIQSKLHQNSIDANTCMEYLKKYFKKLDQRSTIERNKSKEISLLVQNAYNQTFGKFADIIDRVLSGVDLFVQGIQQQVEVKSIPKKKVGFSDIVDAKLAVDRGEKNLLDPTQQENLQVAKNIIKQIHMGAKGLQMVNAVNNNSINLSKMGIQIIEEEPNKKPDSPHKALENLHMIKSMARSYFEPQAMNTNAFDIRFYEKMAEEQKKYRGSEEQIVQLGSSMILSGAPRVEEIAGGQEDPLRISRFLLKTIDRDVQQQQKVLHNKQYQKDIKEGVSHNYYKQKIKLENKPTRFDSQGKSKYSVLLPVGYYESYIVGQSVPDQEKWYLRAHHVQTLTQNPLSKKDNVLNTQYQSKLQKLGAKKRPDEFVIEQNVKRKQSLISELEERLVVLKNEINNARRGKQIPGQKVHSNLVNDYYNKISDGKEDKELELAAYEGVLYDLRRKQRELLNKCRSKESEEQGEADKKWWEKKDKQFNREARKDRQLISDNTGAHKSYVVKLKNNQIY